jgi:asparagine synthase (glutamine-hydrolysing)
MCGIAGIVSSQERVPADLIEAMCEAQRHRGPDSRGLHLEDGVGLGIQRLRVIDLETGDQPIYNEDRTVVVTLNGEIYNYRELRRELERRGHRFTTNGDTEVIAHLYEDHGPDLVRHLEGMFAFAIWDARRRRLVLARDRVGKKPLFYALVDGRLSYASELGGLMCDSAIPRRIDASSLDCYLAYGYIPAPWSIWEDVRKLPPAHTLIWEEGAISIERYWQLEYAEKLAGTRAELEEELRRLVGAAVRRRLIADVPLGAFLSGGVDSSIVVSEMAAASSTPVETFSIGFDDELYNELPRARQIAQRFATNHREFVVRPDAIELLPRIIRHYGEPFADSSAIPTFLLAEATRKHVTVALNGDGGDESFAGYLRHVANMLTARLDLLPRRGRAALAAAGRRIPSGAEQKGRRAYAQRMLSSLAADAAGRYAEHVSIFGESERANLLKPGFAHTIDRSRAREAITDPWQQSTANTALDVLLDVDVRTYLPDDLLTKVDIATMSYSLEGRSPLLDREVMEFAAALPRRHKAGIRGKKTLLRSAYRGRIPNDILDGRKMGFAVPLGRWLRNGLGSFAREALTAPGSALADVVDQGVVLGMLDAHGSGSADNSRRIWSLLILGEWLDRPEWGPQ